MSCIIHDLQRKRIKLIGKILSTIIRPKPLNLSVKLVLFCFTFINFEVIKGSSSYRKWYTTRWWGVLDICRA
jgi:hypothetical protein